jgi:hypothetical protein
MGLRKGRGVRDIIVGGVAAGIHGALRPTLDLDVVYARDTDNVGSRCARALSTVPAGSASRVAVPA